VQGTLLARDLPITVAAVLFSLSVTFAAGFAAVYQALVATLAGLIIYPFLKARRERLGQAQAPVDHVAGAAGDGTVMPAGTTSRRRSHLRLHRDAESSS
jgi:hypothetical protein